MDIFSPIQVFANIATYDLLKVTDIYWGNAINFFIYDIIKIGLLLIVINYLMAITRYYFPVEKIRDILSSRKWYGFDYLLAALLGVATPFCSCSSIPLFIGFVSAGIPLGVTFTFLIASPLVNEASLFIFPSLFGLKMTIAYNLIGIAISILAGMIIQRLKMDKNVNPNFLKFKTQKEAIKENNGQIIPLNKRLQIWWRDGMYISKTIFPYVLIGVGLGAVIHGFIPRDFVESYLSAKDWWAVPLAVLLGTSLAFMTATVTLSIPGLLILKKAMSWRLLIAFVTVTSLGIMIIGYFFNHFFF